MGNIITEMYVAKVDMQIKSKYGGKKGLLVSSKEILAPTPDYAYDVAEVVMFLEQPKNTIFYNDNLENIIKEKMKKEIPKISQGLSYGRYFKIYEDSNDYGKLTISLKRESL